MKPVEPIVPGHVLPVTTYAKDQPEYQPLPCFKDENGVILTRWKMTLRERVRAFFTGDIYLWVSTFNQALQPVSLATEVQFPKHQMLAPIDKVRAGGNDTIQLVVTTACDKACSNCTELLPFRTDYRFMTLQCFEEAVQSVQDWPGIVALFGGNPCVHPMFVDLCHIIAKYIPPERRGLWTNNVFKHGWIAADTFGKGRLNLNAHGDPEAYKLMDYWFPGRVIAGSDTKASWHSAILVDYRDLQLTEEEWIARRERCDINQKWSASIVQRNGRPYAYFCEVAGALDGIRGENSGILATPGWWRSPMNAYAHQVRNCCDRGCGVPLRLKGHRDIDETYNVSESWVPNTVQQNRVAIDAPGAKFCAESTDYMKARSRE